MGYEKITINVPSEKKGLYDAYLKIAQRENVSLSKLGIKMLEEFVTRHREGNPQMPLVPETRPLYVNPVVEQRRDVMAELLYDIRKAGGRATPAMITHFARIHGYRVKTVRQMEQDLKREGAI